MLAMIVNAAVGSILQTNESMLGVVEIFFYGNIVICSLLIYSMIRGDNLIGTSRKTDKTLGDYSYPIYLIHWQTGALASFIVYGNVVSLKYQFAPLAWLTAGSLVMLGSLLIIKCVDQPIEAIRTRIRGKPPVQSDNLQQQVTDHIRTTGH